jgi:hypothetical protein
VPPARSQTRTSVARKDHAAVVTKRKSADRTNVPFEHACSAVGMSQTYALSSQLPEADRPSAVQTQGLHRWGPSDFRRAAREVRDAHRVIATARDYAAVCEHGERGDRTDVPFEHPEGAAGEVH